MRPSLLPSRTVLIAVAGATLSLLLLVDAGSVLLTRLTTPDRVREAGQAAARAVEGQALTQLTAVLAYDAARAEASSNAVRVSAAGFRVHPDGSVRLSATRTAPTLLLHRVPQLRGLTEIRATETVTAPTYALGAPR